LVRLPLVFMPALEFRLAGGASMYRLVRQRWPREVAAYRFQPLALICFTRMVRCRLKPSMSAYRGYRG
jgi:hypothetical protein